MAEIWVRWNGTALEPTDDCADLAAKLPIGRTLKGDIKVPRDLGRHRHAFLLFKKAHENLPEGWRMSFDTFRKALTVDAGYYDDVPTPDGVLKVPQSIAYGAMDDVQFAAFKDAIIKCLVQRWIPGLDNEAFEMEVMECL